MSRFGTIDKFAKLKSLQTFVIYSIYLNNGCCVLIYAYLIFNLIMPKNLANSILKRSDKGNFRDSVPLSLVIHQIC